MEIILYIVIGLIIGITVGWLFAKAKTTAAIQAEKDAAQQKYNDIDKEFERYKAKTFEQLQTATDNLNTSVLDNSKLSDTINIQSLELADLNKKLTISDAALLAANNTIAEKNTDLKDAKQELSDVKKEYDSCREELSSAKATNASLIEKQKTQKDEMEAMGVKFNREFENIANQILENKSEKFTKLNSDNLKTILDPLGENITQFKAKVEEVYHKESQERFSLGEKVKELAELNKVISDEAHNLTRALKSESKTQGGWGEMILENLLERSGLVKDREYFMEHQLLDEHGNPMRSDSEDKKMRPDAVIKYPDNRNVIIDSKVSLNAFTRCIAAIDEESRVKELSEHISCIKKHIVTLSAKGYDDYNKSLDFVMMFIPSEPAYIAALQADADLWNFAYDRRILLLSPTNLITSLKLIVDLWKREYQNQNALEIAERGAKLYDKFVGFVANLESVGDHLEKAQNKYSEAHKQLSTGSDNLVTQATKLKGLGLKTKKQLPMEIVNTSIMNESID